ncbi:MAG TPA: potassium transporter Kup [Alphaproteobacteria bacterium]|nr:potassium transporter Kup [Alphaproteobacteria bacterium]
MIIAALGVVFGDIGTSPLYMMRDAFGHAGGLPLQADAVMGLLSLVFWSLTLIVTIKYVVLIMQADNRGEGGVLSLASLALRTGHHAPKRRAVLSVLALIGLALFYGDGLITPTVSVLGAVEGLKELDEGFVPFIVPLATVILIGLFLIQRHGTGAVGKYFGPVMLIWFTVLGILGLSKIIENPGILAAISPHYAVQVFWNYPVQAFIGLGAVVLCVTGAEALYADMGHFGKGPIRKAWLFLVFPGLLLNYFGQGALLIADPTAVRAPFYLIAPEWAQAPLVILATLAAVIASQAIISGVFSLTRQAIQLGYLPRMDIRHTSHTEQGQIYIPRVNWLLMIGVIGLVLSFQSSGALTAAYGIAVTGAMAIDAILAAVVARWLWGWSRWSSLSVFGLFFLIDVALFSSNAMKIPQGGWFPLAVAIVAVFVFIAWKRGREALVSKLYKEAMPIKEFLSVWNKTTERVSGTAVFMTSNPGVVPTAFLHNLKHNHVVHERVILMKVNTEDSPRVPDGQRIEVEKLGKGFYAVTAHVGFMERADVPSLLEQCRAQGLAIDIMETTFFLGRETLIPAQKSDLNPIMAGMFFWLHSSALSATRFFSIPPNRVVELGAQIEI